jgi:hypothetical protein
MGQPTTNTYPPEIGSDDVIYSYEIHKESSGLEEERCKCCGRKTKRAIMVAGWKGAFVERFCTLCAVVAEMNGLVWDMGFVGTITAPVVLPNRKCQNGTSMEQIKKAFGEMAYQNYKNTRAEYALNELNQILVNKFSENISKGICEGKIGKNAKFSPDLVDPQDFTSE